MLNPNTKLATLPEMFYDLLAYTTPSAIFLSFLAIINNVDISSIIRPLNELDSFIFETLSAFLIFGALYFIGQICTTVSYYIIANPSIRISKKIDGHNNANDIFIKSVFKIKISAPPDVGAKIMKRYARWVLSRNMVVFSGILFVNSIVKSNNSFILLTGLIFVLSAWDSWGRLHAVSDESKAVCKIINEQNANQSIKRDS